MCFCCMCSINTNLTQKINIYNKSKSLLDEYLDLSFIIQKLEELKKLKFVCLNLNQLSLFNYISNDICTLNNSNPLSVITKLKYFTKDSIKLALSIVSNKNRIINNAKDISEIDKKIFDLMRNDLKI